MDPDKLRTGIEVILVSENIAIDKLRVLEIKDEGNFGNKEIRLKSLVRFPEKEFDFSLFKEGWSLLFLDPFTDAICFSSRASSYSIESALHENWRNVKIEVKK